MRETGSNLARNFTLTFAAIITVAVSLTMVAASFLIGQGINNSFLGLRSEQRLFVYMNPTASEEQTEAVSKAIDDSGQVDTVEFYDRDRTYEEFQTLFRARKGRPRP